MERKGKHICDYYYFTSYYFLKLLVLLSLGKTKLEYFMRQNNTASANVNKPQFLEKHYCVFPVFIKQPSWLN